VSDDANLTPEQEADLRRLLAEARHDDPMPENVAARLDRVLAQLAAGDSELDPARVVELASRRRRKASTLLVAAAAIIAIGVGIGHVMPIGDSTGSDSTSSAAADTAREKSSAEALLSDQAGYGVLPQSAPDPGSRLTAVSSMHFTADVRRVSRRVVVHEVNNSSLDSVRGDAEGLNGAAPTSGDAPELDRGGSAQSYNSAAGANGARAPRASDYDCAPAVWGPGRLMPVMYDGEPAVLAFRRPTGDSRVVDLLECGTGDILRSVTLPRH
jgi:hypothetical protein